MVSASGVSSSHKKNLSQKKRFLSSDPKELCARIRLLPQEKNAGTKYWIIYERVIAIVDKFLEYKCISTKQHKCLILKCLN